MIELLVDQKQAIFAQLAVPDLDPDVRAGLREELARINRDLDAAYELKRHVRARS